MKVIGLTLSVLLILPILATSALADTKNMITKDTTQVQYPSQDKTVKIIEIRKTRFLPVLFVVELEVCAGKERLYSPWLELKSDMDSVRVKVIGLIMPYSCKTAEFFILAGDPNSITVDFATISYRDYPKVANPIMQL